MGLFKSVFAAVYHNKYTPIFYSQLFSLKGIGPESVIKITERNAKAVKYILLPASSNSDLARGSKYEESKYVRMILFIRPPYWHTAPRCSQEEEQPRRKAVQVLAERIDSPKRWLEQHQHQQSL